MSNFLKGNFEVKNKVLEKVSEETDERSELVSELKKKVLTSLGGSMVYMERTGLAWDGLKDGKPENSNE